jgi:hypothetical protein
LIAAAGVEIELLSKLAGISASTRGRRRLGQAGELERRPRITGGNFDP